MPRSCRRASSTIPARYPRSLSRTAASVIAAVPPASTPANQYTAKIVLVQRGTTLISQSKLAIENEIAKTTVNIAEYRISRSCCRAAPSLSRW